MARIGPVLQATLDRVSHSSWAEGRRDIARLSGNRGSELLPICFQHLRIEPRSGDTWASYSAHVQATLEPLHTRIGERLGVATEPLLAANGLSGMVSVEGVKKAKRDLSDTIVVELDPFRKVSAMNDVVVRVDLKKYRQRHPMGEGENVRVAILDGGIDCTHTSLEVFQSVSVNDQSPEWANDHATQCAGIVASRDQRFPGIAPRVKLLNIKVLLADGGGHAGWVAKGFDSALDLGAQVLSISLGFDHFHRNFEAADAWDCKNGWCILCTAVENVTALGRCVCIVAAGNQHALAVRVRRRKFDTEITCPGNARGAITVGSIEKMGTQLDGFSSHGPTPYKLLKPNLVAPGVDVMSTACVSRGGNSSFKPISNTSAATPIVAGAAALLVEQYESANKAWTAADILADLTRGISPINGSPNEFGVGALMVGSL